MPIHAHWNHVSNNRNMSNNANVASILNIKTPKLIPVCKIYEHTKYTVIYQLKGRRFTSQPGLVYHFRQYLNDYNIQIDLPPFAGFNLTKFLNNSVYAIIHQLLSLWIHIVYTLYVWFASFLNFLYLILQSNVLRLYHLTGVRFGIRLSFLSNWRIFAFLNVFIGFA